jgi:hypothetical protein
MSEKRIQAVRMLEVADGYFLPVKEIHSAPNSSELAAQATAVLKAQLKDCLWGKAPHFSREIILALVMEITAEDFDADGPQTVGYSDYEDGLPAETAEPFRKVKIRAEGEHPHEPHHR